MIPDLKTTVTTGFNFDKKGNRSIDLALLSLKIALESYYSTYQAFKHRLHIFQGDQSSSEEIEFNHSNVYCERSTDCLVHFQHFAELVCKSFLRNDHPLLSDIASGKAPIVHKLLHGQQLTTEEEAGVRSIEFSEALDRLCILVKNDQLRDSASAKFILKHESCLDQLNKLRNRIWHRGLFVLRYTALDAFIGGHVLPFVVDVLQHHLYSPHKSLCIPKVPNCGIDPMVSIIDHFKNEAYDIGKVALLKEMGRASFKNPLSYPGKANIKLERLFGNINYQKRSRAEKIAELLAEHGDVVERCPVCDVKSLVVYEETETYPSTKCEEEEVFIAYTHAATCENCGLDLHRQDLKNASEYKLTNIPNYWRDSNLS